MTHRWFKRTGDLRSVAAVHRRRRFGPIHRSPTMLGSQSLCCLGAEAMFFAGLIGAFLVFRIASPVWPPPFQPRLPTRGYRD